MTKRHDRAYHLRWFQCSVCDEINFSYSMADVLVPASHGDDPLPVTHERRIGSGSAP